MLLSGFQDQPKITQVVFLVADFMDRLGQPEQFEQLELAQGLGLRLDQAMTLQLVCRWPMEQFDSAAGMWLSRSTADSWETLRLIWATWAQTVVDLCLAQVYEGGQGDLQQLLEVAKARIEGLLG